MMMKENPLNYFIIYQIINFKFEF